MLLITTATTQVLATRGAWPASKKKKKERMTPIMLTTKPAWLHDIKQYMKSPPSPMHNNGDKKIIVKLTRFFSLFFYNDEDFFEYSELCN